MKPDYNMNYVYMGLYVPQVNLIELKKNLTDYKSYALNKGFYTESWILKRYTITEEYSQI